MAEERSGYVDIKRESSDIPEISDVDEVVLEAMPEDEERILEKEVKDTGFGQEPEVIIDTSGDPLEKYKD